MWPNPQFPVDLATFTEKTLNAKNFIFYAVYILKEVCVRKINVFVLYFKPGSEKSPTN